MRHAERCQARPESNARLAASDDDNVRLPLGAPTLPRRDVVWASMTPSDSEASPTRAQPEGSTVSSVAATIWPMASRPSMVLMFHVKATRSRQ